VYTWNTYSKLAAEPQGASTQVSETKKSSEQHREVASYNLGFTLLCTRVRRLVSEQIPVSEHPYQIDETPPLGILPFCDHCSARAL
jgi:hypothetical protein